ncbi:hypothetical protein [Bdellovibrio sp. BCCA]|uniref:hypothetical protein n=1 Tax=Bdellovibrio sp. BCCA TaxID=3136281 RepID=UPI0030F2B0EA
MKPANTRWHSILKLSVVMLATAFVLTSCTAGDEDKCSGVNSFDPVCGGKDIVDPNILNINYAESKYFDENTNEWSSIRKTDLEETILYKDIQIYPPVATATLDTTLANIKLTEEGAANDDQKNRAFYIKLEAKDGVSYLCSYKKTKNGTVVATTDCTFSKMGNYAYLPFINNKFNGKVYDAGDRLGDTFVNEITIVAQYSATRSSSKTIKFNSIISASNTAYVIAMSEAMLDFSIENRWAKYHKKVSNNNVTNDNLDLFKLSDKKGAVSNPNIDLRVIFKESPRITIEQEVFMEVPIDMNKYASSKEISPLRGFEFRQHLISVNSQVDFMHKITVGGYDLVNSGLEWKRESFPSAVPLDVRVVANLTQNALYTNPHSTTLLQPLKPSCVLEKNLAFDPVKEDEDKVKNANLGKWQGTCQIDQNRTVVVDEPNSSSNTVLLKDSWYNAFDYIPLRSNKNAIGSMYGVKKITFKVQACFKVQTRADNDNSEFSWASVSSGGSNCGDSTSSSDWVYVNYSKTYSLTNDLEKYGNDPELKNLLDKLRVAYPVNDSAIKFNGEVLNGDQVKHIY